MITLTILLVILAFLAGVGALVGLGFLTVFGDLLVCIGIIWLLVKLFSKKDESQN